jgi:hypothetical protein
VTTDPYLHAIDVSGLGGGIEYYLAGSGPAVVVTGSHPVATVTSLTRPAPPMGLCRTLLSHASA